MTDLDRAQINSVAAALDHIGDNLERECIEGRHIDLAVTRHHAQQLKVLAQLLSLIAKGEPCNQQ